MRNSHAWPACQEWERRPKLLRGPGLAHLLHCYWAVPLSLSRAMHSPPLPTGAHRWQPIPSIPWRDPDGSNYALEGQPAQESHPNACSVLMWAQESPEDPCLQYANTGRGKFQVPWAEAPPTSKPLSSRSLLTRKAQPSTNSATWKDTFYFS